MSKQQAKTVCGARAKSCRVGNLAQSTIKSECGKVIAVAKTTLSADADTMIDWNLVKKTTLWDYEELIEKMSGTFSYAFVQECYNHTMKEAADYVKRLLGYDQKHEKHVSRMISVFNTLDGLKTKNYSNLISRVESKEKCEDFLRKTQLPFDDLICALNHIFRWVLPHNVYLRELIDTENEPQKNHIEGLRRHRIRFNLDVLEYGRTREDREKLSKETGIPRSFIFDLVNLADMSRLPYSNRKTVRHLSAGGYNSIAKLAQTDSKKMMDTMKSYFDRIGVKLTGFIDLEGIAQWARTLPAIIED